VRVDCSDFYQEPPTLARRPRIPPPCSCLRLSITYIDSRMAFSIPLYLYVFIPLSHHHLSFSFCLHWCRYIIQLSTYESPQTSPRGVRLGIMGELKYGKKRNFPASSVKIGWKLMPGSSVPGIQYTEWFIKHAHRFFIIWWFSRSKSDYWNF